MRRPCLALFCLVLLCAFDQPPPYDIAALPDAAAARQHALNLCQARAAAFKTLRASVDCGLAAHRLYAVTEKLRDMASFQAYAAQVRRAASDADAGHTTQADASRQAAATRADFQAGIDKQYAAWQAGQTAAHKGPLFDRAALPVAKTTRDKAVNACGPWIQGKLTPHAACVLAAEKSFAAAIKLQDMALFYGYASVLRVNTVDAEDGKRAPAQMEGLHQAAWSNFLKTLDQGYAGVVGR